MHDEVNSKKFIFVGGAPRSGTTLLQNILDSHPDITGGPEFYHIPDIITVRHLLQANIERKLITEFVSSQEADKITAQYIANLLLPLLHRQGGKFLSEKTPQNVLVFDVLMALFPEAKFIQIIRDPRATIASMLQVGIRAKQKGITVQSFTYDITSAIKTVKNHINAGFSAAAQEPDRSLTIIYEKLVVDLEVETKRICRFLGVEWSKNMITPGSFEHLGEKPITNSKLWYDSNTYNRDPQDTEIAKWKRQLKPYQQVWISKAFQNYSPLAKCDYDFSLSNISLFSRIYGEILFYIMNAKVVRLIKNIIMPLPKWERDRAVELGID